MLKSLQVTSLKAELTEWGSGAEKQKFLGKEGAAKTWRKKQKPHGHDRHLAAPGKGCNFSSKEE